METKKMEYRFKCDKCKKDYPVSLIGNINKDKDIWTCSICLTQEEDNKDMVE